MLRRAPLIDGKTSVDPGGGTMSPAQFAGVLQCPSALPAPASQVNVAADTDAGKARSRAACSDLRLKFTTWVTSWGVP